MTDEALTPAELALAARVLPYMLRTNFSVFVGKSFQAVCPGVCRSDRTGTSAPFLTR